MYHCEMLINANKINALSIQHLTYFIDKTGQLKDKYIIRVDIDILVKTYFEPNTINRKM